MVCQREFTHRITGRTKKALNSFDLERLEHPVSQAYPAIALPSSPRHSIPIDGGSLTEKQVHRETGKVFIRCTYIFCGISCCNNLFRLLAGVM